MSRLHSVREDTQRGDGSQRGHCPPPYERGLGSLLKELANETRTLLRQEVELAKTELSEKAAKAGRNVAYLAAGGFVIYLGVLALLAALTIGLAVVLAQGMEVQHAAWLAPLIVGIVVAVIGYAVLKKGLATLKRMRFTPTKTINSMRENKEWLRDRITHSNGRTQ